jgi:glycosyltransferase involved in cell wall biosynthesis
MIRVGVVIENLDDGGAPANYAHALVEALADDPRVEPVLFYCRGTPDDVPAGVARVDCPDRPYPTGLLPDRPQLPRLPRLEREHGVDLFHLNRIPDLGHWQVRRTECPVVATVHGTLHWEDLPVRTLPTGYRYRRRLFDRLGRYTLDRAFAVSDYVGRLLVDRAGYPESRVACTYEAIDDAYFELPAQDPPDGVPEEYLLHVSSQAPKKNLRTLLHALDAMDDGTELVVAGSGWRSTCERLVSDLGLSGRVQFRGFVPQAELIGLYDHATCFVFPSYHETFGLPNVEAMARGTPVVTSDVFAIPEIVGSYATLVADPGDAGMVCEAVESVLSSEDGPRADTANRSRAWDFSWRSHLDTLVRAYRRVME